MKKKLVLIIVFSLILKSAAFAIGMEGGIDTSSPVIQSAVFQVVSVLNMPSTIVAKMMKEMPLVNGSGEPLKGPAEKKSNRAPDSKCLFLDPKEGSKSKLKAVNTCHGWAALTNDNTNNISVTSKVMSSPWETVICFIISMFLIFLPRRGLPWESTIKSLSILPNCPASRIIGFFHLYQPKAGLTSTGRINDF